MGSPVVVPPGATSRVELLGPACRQVSRIRSIASAEVSRDQRGITVVEEIRPGFPTRVPLLFPSLMQSTCRLVANYGCFITRIPRHTNPIDTTYTAYLRNLTMNLHV